MRRALLVSIILIGLLATSMPPAHAGARIRIGRIRYDPPGTDSRTNKHLNKEWIRLENRGDRKRNIRG